RNTTGHTAGFLMATSLVIQRPPTWASQWPLTQPTDGAYARETESPLTRAGSLWGDLAVMVHTVKAVHVAVK
ncbi:hypothetical protein ACWCQP_48730, partial [Streptomyces chartreusis]